MFTFVLFKVKDQYTMQFWIKLNTYSIKSRWHLLEPKILLTAECGPYLHLNRNQYVLHVSFNAIDAIFMSKMRKNTVS